MVVDEDHGRLLGVTMVGPGVEELIHSATVAVAASVPIARLWHAVPCFPTISEVWLRLLEAYRDGRDAARLVVTAQVGAEEPDQELARQGGGAHAAEGEDQHPDGVQVGLDQPEHADHQPEQDDQGHRADVSAAHVPECHFCENVASSPACTRSVVAVHIA
jgi:hypothetical protein